MSRARRIARGTAFVLIAMLVALWLVRKPIATRFVDRTLAAANVPARYAIADLGFGGQRLTDVVIGDPAAPDLVADWIETRTRIGASGPELSGVRAGRVRVRGRLVDGRLSFGAIDRLLPKSGGGAFALPKLNLSVEDGRMRLETPYGVAGVALRGRGGLDGGFEGRLALVSERLGTAACAGERVAGALRVRSDGGIALDGPLNVARVRCGGVSIARWRNDIVARIIPGERRGSSLALRLTTGPVRHRLGRVATVSGTVGVEAGVENWLTADLVGAEASGFGATAGRLGLTGRGLLRPNAPTLAARVTFEGRAWGERMRLPVRAFDLAGLAGTPLAPLAQSASAALRKALDGFRADTRFAFVGTHDARVKLDRLAFRAASGARASLAGGRGITVWLAGDSSRIDTRLRVAGGGLPSIDATFREAAFEPVRGTINVAPYAAAGARLALTPVAFAAEGVGGPMRVRTTATLSGPLGDGRIDGLTVPLDLRLQDGRLTANPRCTPVGFEQLTLSGLALRPARLSLCPTGPALVRIANGEIRGGARLAATSLTGTLGTTPVALALSGATLRLADRGFALAGVQARIGAPGRVTRLDFARIEGKGGQGGIAGTFAGGAGQIANVPLLLADAAGDWRFANGALRLNGALGVSDAQTASSRFQPMQARAVSLGLADGAIAANGTLHEPTTGTKVATVAITHALAAGTGRADLAVPGLAFVQGFQPELLTRLTFGVIADVRGTVSGDGRIAWSPDGVASTGTFRTAGTDLAAAFGPVTGIAGTIRFTDLLALESAPDQIVTITSINPGIAVTDGTIRYRTLRDTRVRVERGEWPFAGGRLTLDPTTLDFGRTGQRRMTFRIAGVAADRFLQQFDFKNLDATGTFDGVLPMVFDDAGGRIEDGRMTVREGGGTIRYVGELTREDVGFWGNLAFQALKSLRYRSLTLAMNGPLAGEMVTDVRFAGVSQGEGAKANFLIRRLQRLPFVFNVRIKAPFRGLIDSAQSFYEPRRLIQRNLPQLIDEQNARAVQPPASATPITEDRRR